MNVQQVIEEINNLSDELEPDDIVLPFINDAISAINVECDSNFPTFTMEDLEEEIPLPEKWIRTLIIPFGVGRIKQRDSSEFEYTNAYREFQHNLDTFKAKYDIPEEYQDEEGSNSSYESTIYQEPPYRWWNW